MPDLNFVETLPDHDVVLIGILCFITDYLFPRDYKKVVNQYLFAFLEDFPMLNSFPWGKLLFEITLSSLKDALSRKFAHYMLRGMLIEICDLVPTEAQMEMSYMDGVQHNKPIQPEFLEGSHLKESRKGKSVDPARMSEESVHLVTDIGVEQTHIIDEDDDFVDPLRQCEVTSHQETPRADEGPSAAQHSPNEPQYHGMQWSALKNKVLTVEMDAIKSQMSSLNVDQTKKMTEIILMQGQLKRDMTEIRMNMQFLSEPVTAMISSSMDEILRWFNDKKGSHVNEFGDTEAAIVGGEEGHVVGGFDKIDEVGKLEPIVDRKGKGKVDPTDDVAFPCSLQPLSFDLSIGYTQSDDFHSAEIQKQVDAIISDVITTSKNVDEKHMDACFYYIRQVAKFGKVILIKAVTGHIISLSTSWTDVDYVFMPLLPTNKDYWTLGLVQFRNHTLMLFISIGKTYRDWKVLEGIEPCVKVLPALIKAVEISKKYPDYNEAECKELKVTIDSTLPQQTNG
ncbi:Hypothetical predicted protein [Olea europaea subsp. europaea]|uniref:Ubiquitin-like protease family profile domain-containing protein n=1 Tax=Olea europaea subsp. europaea TaxID=158383 RepID=A0A8S0RCB7_OLEEU|nr:Hypothetical predicted protein [Olea europaea subsp. europaea]